MMFYCIFQSSNLVILEYLVDIERSKISQFKVFKYFKIAGGYGALLLDPFSGPIAPCEHYFHWNALHLWANY